MDAERPIKHLLLTEHLDLWTAADTAKKSGRGRGAGNAASVYGIKKLRELILELAVRGKLVLQDANDEPASELLKRIQAEKAQLMAEGKIKKGKPLAAIAEDEKPFDLPQGWGWVKMNEIATQITDGAHHTPEYISEGVPFLSVKNLSSARLDFSDTRFISLSAHEELTKRCNAENAGAIFGQSNWQRIAAYFDTLFTTEASIDALKQTLLQLAVMGKLVPQDANDEPVSELLKRIQAEKAKLIAEGKIKKDKPLAAIAEDEKPFELPAEWEWLRLGDALDITGGVTLGRKITGADLVELPYLRVANVQRGHLVLDSIKTVEIRQSELGRYQLLKGDLLVTEGGDWDKVGRTAIWNSEIESCLHQNHIFRMRRLTKDLSSSWIEMYMNSIAKAYFQAASKQTTNLASINMTQLKSCVIAVPSLREQHRIVAKVDELTALCDQLKSRLTAAYQLQQKLADGVVEQAIAQ
ncbi:restriction endonuclease subunit S [Methylomonas albis]|uniref:Restriction endonuclease subunit S n=1 Tax=Methylomonas albis TaxID=1854563 RepID=A0ABR9D3I3_9GAMM|nr:restriction endonuclease subunit S [Methylomonas albis]MBD9357678.1 restriction endonuclease subunit S [Methylomonas albis]